MGTLLPAVRRALLAILLTLSLTTPAAATMGCSGPVPAPAEQATDCKVWVTRTGYRYHRSTCGYLRYSRRETTRRRAWAEGYTPCRVCGGSPCEA